MAIPTVFAVGTFANGTTGTVTPGAPAGSVAGDIWILLVESANQTPNAIAGFSNVGIGTVSQATGLVTALTVRWYRCVGGDTAPGVTTPATQDHIAARIIGVRGCIASGSPVNTTQVGTDNTTGTTFSIPGSITSTPDCLVIAALSTGTDVNSSAMASGWTNASLASLTERVDDWTVSGNGGGIAAASGGLAAIGSYNATTGTLTTGNTKAFMSFALRPPTPSADPYTYVGGDAFGNGPIY